MATSSDPPTSRRISSGSVTPAIRRTDSWTAARLRASPSSSTPVPRPHPGCGLAAGECGGDRRRRCRVADADLSEDQQVAVERVDGLEGEFDDLVEALGGKRRFVADVAGRSPDADVDRADRRPGDPCERGDGRAALFERPEERFGDPGRIRADLGRGGHAVVGGEHQRRGPIDGGGGGPLPTGDPRGDLVEPGQRPARPQEMLRSLVDRVERRLVVSGQIGQPFAQRRCHAVVPQ